MRQNHFCKCGMFVCCRFNSFAQARRSDCSWRTNVFIKKFLPQIVLGHVGTTLARQTTRISSKNCNLSYCWLWSGCRTRTTKRGETLSRASWLWPGLRMRRRKEAERSFKQLRRWQGFLCVSVGQKAKKKKNSFAASKLGKRSEWDGTFWTSGARCRGAAARGGRVISPE